MDDPVALFFAALYRRSTPKVSVTVIMLSEYGKDNILDQLPARSKRLPPSGNSSSIET
jgi:hypothetical protein